MKMSFHAVMKFFEIFTLRVKKMNFNAHKDSERFSFVPILKNIIKIGKN